MSSSRGLAIVNVLVFTILFTILAGSLLVLVSSHTILMEDTIRRTKAFYVAEAGYVHAMDLVKVGLPPTNPQVEWSVDGVSGATLSYNTPAVEVFPGAGLNGSMLINSTCDYTPNW